MLLTLLSHQWKAFWRSKDADKSIITRVLIGLIVVYFLGSALVLGIFLGELLKELHPGMPVVPLFTRFILYYYFIDIVVRYFFQELPTLAVQPYLSQNIKKKQLVGFLNVRSLFHYLNLIPLFLFVPFTIRHIGGEFGVLTAVAFLLMFTGLTLGNHFLGLFVKRKSIISTGWFMGFFAVVIVLAVLDYFQLIKVTNISQQLFGLLIRWPALCILPLLWGITAWLINGKYLFNNLYIEEFVKAGKRKEGTEYNWLNRFGELADLTALDIKLIFRHKRSKNIFFLSMILLFYGFIFYKPEFLQRENFGMLLFGAVFVTGGFIINYGNFLFAWQSMHFDGLMANNISVRNYIKSKLLLFTLVGTATFIITSFYGLIDWRLLPLQLAAFLFNIGCTSILSAYFATFSSKALDLSKGSSFNYQGTGGAQWLYALVVLVIPMLIYLPFFLIWNSWAGITAIGVIGLVSFLLQDWWVSLIVKAFNKRKYTILEGFREK